MVFRPRRFCASSENFLKSADSGSPQSEQRCQWLVPFISNIKQKRHTLCLIVPNEMWWIAAVPLVVIALVAILWMHHVNLPVYFSFLCFSALDGIEDPSSGPQQWQNIYSYIWSTSSMGLPNKQKSSPRHRSLQVPSTRELILTTRSSQGSKVASNGCSDCIWCKLGYYVRS